MTAESTELMLRRAVADAIAEQRPAAPQEHGCGCGQHAPARGGWSAGKVAAAAVGGCAACAAAAGMFLAVALTAIAVAFGGLVLLLVVRELRKGPAR